MTGLLGITLGDVTGIGPEVTLKALAAELPNDSTRYVIVGDHGRVARMNDQLGLGLTIAPYGAATSRPGRIFVHQPPGEPLAPELPRGSATAARAAVAWLKEAARLGLAGEIDGVVTAPVNKEAIVRAGIRFVGQTELLSECAATTRTAMMLLGEDDRGRWLRVALATTHVPLRKVADCLTVEGVTQCIELAAQACRQLGLGRSRVAVCGLNPHAGEGGQMGTEEQTIIAPAVAEARARGIDVAGPHSADALFYYVFRGDYDAVVAMYHDQGLVPLKMVTFETGINWTLGLPFIRTSPDHGTGYDIAGQGKANPSSMICALRLAKKLAAAGPV